MPYKNQVVQSTTIFPAVVQKSTDITCHQQVPGIFKFFFLKNPLSIKYVTLGYQAMNRHGPSKFDKSAL